MAFFTSPNIVGIATSEEKTGLDTTTTNQSHRMSAELMQRLERPRPHQEVDLSQAVRPPDLKAADASLARRNWTRSLLLGATDACSTQGKANLAETCWQKCKHYR